MFKNLFGKKEEPVDKLLEIKSPMNGKYVKIEDIPDPVFSEKMMGEGFGILPSDGEVVSPVDGEIMQVFPTNHAVGIKAENGMELLIHIGLETVAMDGAGFTGHVSEGDNVQTGDALVSFDLDLVTKEADSTISPVVITNSDALKSFDILDTGETAGGRTIVAKAELN